VAKLFDAGSTCQFSSEGWPGNKTAFTAISLPQNRTWKFPFIRKTRTTARKNWSI